MTKRLFALMAVLALAGCAVDKQTTPPLAGPSELGLSLAISATPDIITQDGHSQAIVEVIARDASSQFVPGVSLRADVLVDGVPTDFGSLSSKTVSTGSDGRARLTYRAPAAPPATQTSDTIVTLAVTPVGQDYSGATPRYVQIRLARPGVILPPKAGPGTPVPSFFFSPAAPKTEDDVYFDASASSDDGEIVEYSWNFGDGEETVTSSPSTRHRFELAGTFNVVLTVTDDRGISATSAAQQVEVSNGADPTAAFVTSPAAPKQHQNVGFNASASKAIPGRSIVEYRWDFGDGTPEVVTSNPLTNHTFTAAAGYTVTLRVIDSAGQFAVVSNTVTVAP